MAMFATGLTRLRDARAFGTLMITPRAIYLIWKPKGCKGQKGRATTLAIAVPLAISKLSTDGDKM
jgi:hypothetical protein